MGRKKKIINKEDLAEDCCFQCKDGGLLRVCDYKDCLKAYHPQCVEKDDSFLESEVPWSCRWHSCFICKKSPKFLCFCCPNAVCGCCLYDAEFAVVRGKRGFCNHCLTLTGLIEGLKDPDANEGKIDFRDRDTYEFMFKCYWEMIKKKENLALESVRFAKRILNEGRNYGHGSHLEDIFEGSSDSEDENQLASSYDDTREVTKHKMQKGKRKAAKPYATKRKVNSKKKEFVGWGSKPLLDFLTSIGKDTTIELSQHDAAAIITGYCKENKLFHPEKKKKVICDTRLKFLLGRNSVNKNSIYKLLTIHFAENFEQSDGGTGHSSEDNGGNVLIFCKKQRNSGFDSKPQIKGVPDVQQSCFASVISKNIKLIYLKRSLVEEMRKEPETFGPKVIGSFVRVKSDPNDYLQKNSHQLVQVIAIKETAGKGAINSEILFQVTNMIEDIPISKLSDIDFSEEECEDLRRRVKDGLLRRPTFVELQEKAQTLHEVIMKHWIVKELARLQNLINLAHEKAWKRECSEYMDRMKLLQTPTEQQRLLNEIPEIIADEAEIQPNTNDSSRNDEQRHDSVLESSLTGMLKPLRKKSEGNGSPCFLKGASDVAEMQQSKKLHQQSHAIGGDENKYNNILQAEELESFQGVVQPRASHPEMLSAQSLSNPKVKSNSLLQEEQYQCGKAISGKRHNEQAVVEHEKAMKKQCEPVVELIQLSDDEEEDAGGTVGKHSPAESLNSSVWNCISPHGVIRGPYSMSLLKQWSDSCSYELKFKVWKNDQSPEEAIFITDAIRQVFSGK